MQEKIRNYIQGINNEFQEIHGGCFINLSTVEIFTSTEVKKYTKTKIELFMKEIQQEVREESDKAEIPYEQRLINDRTSKQYRKNKTNKKKTKERYEGGDFNIVYKDEKLEELIMLKMNNNEKLTYYILRDFVNYPYNCVMIKDKIPRISDLEPLIGLSNKSIRMALKSLEDKNVLKLVQCGHRKAIYINPSYYASGKDLDIETLQIFGLIECDDNKISQYIENNY